MTKQSKENAQILGGQNLLFQTQEECGELIKAIGKYNRTNGIGQRTEMGKDEAFEKLLSEIADVSICIEQLIYILDVNKEIKEYKKAAFDKVSARYSDAAEILKNHISKP